MTETSVSDAPAADKLPDAPALRTVRVADPAVDYAYADSAYDFADALGDAPPDYAFDHDGTDPSTSSLHRASMKPRFIRRQRLRSMAAANGTATTSPDRQAR